MNLCCLGGGVNYSTVTFSCVCVHACSVTKFFQQEPSLQIKNKQMWCIAVHTTAGLADSQNFRKTVIAIWAISALIEHICWENFEEEMQKDCDKFLRSLASQQPAYAVIQEASNCLKHAVRSRGKPKAAGSASVKIRGRGWGEAEFGVDEYGGAPIALVDYIDGQSVSIKHAIQMIEAWIQTQLEKD